MHMHHELLEFIAAELIVVVGVELAEQRHRTWRRPWRTARSGRTVGRAARSRRTSRARPGFKGRRFVERRPGFAVARAEAAAGGTIAVGSAARKAPIAGTAIRRAGVAGGAVRRAAWAEAARAALAPVAALAAFPSFAHPLAHGTAQRLHELPCLAQLVLAERAVVVDVELINRLFLRFVAGRSLARRRLLSRGERRQHSRRAQRRYESESTHVRPRFQKKMNLHPSTKWDSRAATSRRAS
jgi:hypothetical protein